MWCGHRTEVAPLDVDEAARHRLYTRLAETLGEQPTSTLMSLLPPVGWAYVATKDDLRSLESSLRGEMAQLRSELRGEMGELRGEVATDIAGLESRLTTALRQQLFAMIAAMVTIAGLAVAGAATIV